MAPVSDKQTAYDLIEQLDTPQLAAVVQLLKVMTDPLSSAPVEEAEVSAETSAAIARARESLTQGKGIPQDEVLREFGITK